RYRRNGEEDADRRIELAHGRDGCIEAVDDLLEPELMERVDVGVVLPSDRARAHGVLHPGCAVAPGFGQAQGEHEDVGGDDAFPKTRDGVPPRRQQLVLAAESGRFDPGPERVDEPAVLAPGFRWRL